MQPYKSEVEESIKCQIQIENENFKKQFYTSLENLLNQAAYINDKKLILMPKVGFGFLGFYNSKKGLTPFERFKLGGNGLRLAGQGKRGKRCGRKTLTLG